MNAPPDEIRRTLAEWLESRLTPPASDWLAERRRLVGEGDSKALFLGIGLIGRKLPKDDLALSRDELRRAAEVRPGWDPTRWSVDQAARLLLLFEAPLRDEAAWTGALDALFAAADVGEQIALYQGLPLYPFPEAHRFRATDGLRTNIKGVFEAIAHRNPYMAEQASDDSWNQMVLKTLFIGSTLRPIVGLDQRANPALAQMLIDYAHERWAAGRAVTPELWRCVGSFLSHGHAAEMERILSSADVNERTAGALALSAAPSDVLSPTREKFAAELNRVSMAGLEWDSLALEPIAPAKS
ncbi:MAG TPA: EboA domain-containing protein [Pirellulaceae bacterium]|jgi:hypothetical protein|nr:EboA domain-containing protein [Pirellulaceae bacterium]